MLPTEWEQVWATPSVSKLNRILFYKKSYNEKAESNVTLDLFFSFTWGLSSYAFHLAGSLRPAYRDVSLAEP